MSVSESIGDARVVILNKSKAEGKVGVRTRDYTAKKVEDYIEKVEIIDFQKGQADYEFTVTIIDDSNWEPDEDFFVELFEIGSEKKLDGRDTECKITILDDDKPGQLAFVNPNVRHAAVGPNSRIVSIDVKRIHDADGVVTVEYKTIEINEGERTARTGIDFEEAKGTLKFPPNEVMMTIDVKIIDKELSEDQERDEIFGLKLYNAFPAGVKISKRDVCRIELVKDAKAARQ